jgi:GxxExxY protein
VDVNSVTESVIGAAFEVSNTLGAGFLEKVYERALVSELALRGIAVATQATYPVAYKGHISPNSNPTWWSKTF